MMTHFRVSVPQEYCVVKGEGDRGPWKVHTVRYIYALLTDEGQEIFAYHWHPDGRSPITTPHFQFGAGAGVQLVEARKAHFPTRRIALEEFLRCAIRDFGMVARRDDWDAVLRRTQDALEQWRTWG